MQRILPQFTQAVSLTFDLCFNESATSEDYILENRHREYVVCDKDCQCNQKIRTSS